MNKKRKRKYIILFIILFIIVAIILYTFLFKKTIKSKKYLDEIDGYNYTLEKRDTQLFKDTFAKLKETLNEDEINYEAYALYLSQLYVIDLYTLSNKESKYDVGSVEYVYPIDKEEYISKVEDSLYNYIALMDDKPTVASIDLEGKIIESDYTYNENKYDAYTLMLTWEYEKDLGYDESGKITLVKIDNQLYVASFEPGD